MSISARNQLKAKISHIKKGTVNDQIELQLSNGEKLISIITADSTKNLSLAEGADVIAIFKASFVLLSVANNLKLSVRNQLQGTIKEIKSGAVNTEVIILTGNNVEIVSIITNTSAANLKLTEGSTVTAIIKASAIILAVPY